MAGVTSPRAAGLSKTLNPFRDRQGHERVRLVLETPPRRVPTWWSGVRGDQKGMSLPARSYTLPYSASVNSSSDNLERVEMAMIALSHMLAAFAA